MSGARLHIDRRRFVVGTGLTFAAVSAWGAALPVALPDAHPAAGLPDWSVDDMWTGYPRPAEAIGFARPAVGVVGVAMADCDAPRSIEALFG